MKNKKRPRVVLIGRMNVGKSTLFNRLSETNRAIISSLGGTTRDVKNSAVKWRGVEFDIVDSGGLDVKEADAPLEKMVVQQTERALRESEIAVFMIDGQTGVLPQDKKILKKIKTFYHQPIFLVVNKIDKTKDKTNLDTEIFKLNIEPIFYISAKNGRGSGDLLDALWEVLAKKTVDITQPNYTAIAIVGRPNVGKSSLLNGILNEERVIVADSAHTTRDSNDIPYTYQDKNFLLVDTAGIRKQANVGKRWPDQRLGDIEKKSVQTAMQAIERADVVVLVLEAQKKIGVQDKKISQLAAEGGKGLLIVVNKWDLIEEKTPSTINEFRDYFDGALPFLRWAPIIFVSAKDKLRLKEILNLVVRITDNYQRKIDFEDLKPILKKVESHYRPKQSRTRKYKKTIVRFKSLVQSSIRPPRFILSVTRPKDLPLALIDIFERELRSAFDFEGVKIIIEVKK
ncbi:MAG: ribosome biogenesis GTPase Der [Candidatus Kerfeldbacteria bacterium RIFOXYA2_FULL_38_24]|uniref:GTPase Der n=1 Tax=Candidatus Kerfeldbacteria bacterium RIFOXYB2_FULL_38_14 TaxID=1798547 RepID=A0A1G2BIZ3_9BACT|nr:MAG: ribosome biogenesis GTPase Der [Candidatus Kerfeldbacteria bacterium RIFOXYA2_FULL_38_24]OGY88270.1 MAG: ribosome biogenesis GTPase Der [Candidatus Kerfeldbacteria bacterium RIFOXYB2_FULL_38_14]